MQPTYDFTLPRNPMPSRRPGTYPMPPPPNDWYVLKKTADATEAALRTLIATKADATALALKQDLLVSGTNIKTIGGQTLLGTGDIPLPSVASASWGSITGTLSNQTDLAVVLAAKAPSEHSHSADVWFSTAMSSKASVSHSHASDAWFSGALATKSDTGHNHVSDAWFTGAMSGKADSVHTHASDAWFSTAMSQKANLSHSHATDSWFAEAMAQKVAVASLKAAVANPSSVKLSTADIKEYLVNLYNAVQAL